jgi:hypothetical protein
MADYYTHFSCLLDVGTHENAVRALEIFKELAEDGETDEPLYSGIIASIQSGPNGTQIWMRDDGNGDVDGVIEFVTRCAKEFRLTGRWGFQYANSCSKPRLDGFGGGAHVIDLATGEPLGWMCTDGWLANVLDGGNGDA